MRKSVRLKYLIMALALCLPVPAMAEDWVTVDIGETTVRWDVQGDLDQVVLTVAMPNGKVIRREVRAGEPVVFAVDDAAKDGVYRYELRGIQRFDDSVRKELAAARKAGDEFDVIESLKDAGRLPRDPAVKSGAFAVKGGVLVRPDVPEDIDPKTPKAAQPAGKAAGGGNGVQIITAADQVIPDDLIVQGSACVGLDCINNENFSFDTIRLKENNLRIHFDDTSALPGFPANDWRLIANDSASGGSSKFSIEDSTGARTPFTVEAGATTNSIFVDSTGRVGFRTSTPVLDLHINTSNTPAIRLEQNNSGGFTAQTWDIGANEANFFVRDVTGGSRLSFRIRPGAPTSSIDISADGDVGIGTASPSTNLHVASSDGDATGHFLVTETNGTIATRTMAQFSNNGGVRVEWIDTSGGGTWGANLINGNFNILKAGTGVTAFSLQGNGTLTVVDLIESSDRDMKTDIVAVQAEEILSKVRRLPLSTWRFKDGDKATHLGPMAQDFSALFGLGHDDKHIKALDVAGVSLAAVQALSQQVSAKDAEIAELKNQNGDLAKRLADLEALVSSLAGQQK